MPGPDLSPPAIAKLIEDEKVTVAAGVPTIWMGVLPELEGRDTSSLRAIPCGGSAVPRALSEGYREQVGLPIMQAWGMTETSPVASVGRIKSSLEARLSDDEKADLRTTVGQIALGVDFRVVDPVMLEPPAVGRRVVRRAAGARPVDRPLVLQRRAVRRVVHRGRMAADRRHGGGDARRLHQARRPHQGRHQVGRRVDLVRRPRERDHGPSEGRRGGGHRRRASEVGRAAAGLRRREAGRGAHEGGAARVADAEGGEVVAARRRRVHRRGAEDQRRQVLEEGPARQVRHTTSCPRDFGVPRPRRPSCRAPPVAGARSSTPELPPIRGARRRSLASMARYRFACGRDGSCRTCWCCCS